jgi:hypothetical protein
MRSKFGAAEKGIKPSTSISIHYFIRNIRCVRFQCCPFLFVIQQSLNKQCWIFSIECAWQVGVIYCISGTLVGASKLAGIHKIYTTIIWFKGALQHKVSHILKLVFGVKVQIWELSSVLTKHLTHFLRSFLRTSVL